MCVFHGNKQHIHQSSIFETLPRNPKCVASYVFDYLFSKIANLLQEKL